MLEAAFVFDSKGEVIMWHQPPHTTSSSIPDSRDLWEVLWEHRSDLGGIAHLHPWKGVPQPSSTDVSTFRALELALGRLLLWPVVSMDDVRFFGWNPITKQYVPCPRPSFVDQLDLSTLRLFGHQKVTVDHFLVARTVGKSRLLSDPSSWIKRGASERI